MNATAAFSLTLEDAFSPSASKAKASLVSFTSELATAKTQLAGYQSQLALSKELGDVAGYKKYSGLVQGAQRSVFDLTQKVEGSAGALESGSTAAGGMAAGLGLVAAAALVASKAVGGLVSVTESLAEFTLRAANENQHQIAVFEAMGGGAEGAGKKTLAMLDEVGSKLPQSEAQLVSWTKHIQAMGVTDLSKIRSELVATASAQAIMGDEGAAAYQKIQQRVQLAAEAHHGLKLAEKSLTALYKAGVNEADVAKRMGMTTTELGAKLKAGTIDAAKFGNALRAAVTEKGKGPLDVAMNSLDAMSNKLKKSIGDLFEETDTKPLTDALRNLLVIFEDGTPSANGMKMGIVGAMNAIISVLGHGITEAEIFFLEIEVAGLQAYIALKPLIGAIGTVVDGMKFVSGSIGKVNANADAALGAKAGTNDKITGLVSVNPFTQMKAVFDLTVGSLADSQALAVANQQGLAVGQATVAGIRQGVDAHSPSREAMKIGMDIGSGLGSGMEGSPAPERAARTISSNALGGIGGAKGLAGAANDTGTTSNVFNIHITAPDGVTDAQQLSIVGLSTAIERFQIGSGR